MRTLEVFGRQVWVEYAAGRWTAFHPNAEGKRAPVFAASIPAFVQTEAELAQYLADLWHEEARPDRGEVRWLTGSAVGSGTVNPRAGTERDMSVHTRIHDYLTAQPPRTRADMEALHDMMLRVMPDGRLWFLDGKDEGGRTVSNPNIGYGLMTIAYADGRTREFYQIGLSANTAGISVYIMGLDDKTYLAETYGGKLGKAKVTGYCIKFRALRNIDLAVLEAAIRDGIARTST